MTVIGRALPVKEPSKGARAVSGPGVTVHPLPNYCGIRQFARHYFAVRKLIRNSLREPHAVHLSLPCVIGDLVWRALEPYRPFGVAVCGDPHDALAPGATKHPLRPIMRAWFARRLRLECKQACTCTYVTREVLQRQYPCAPGAFSTYYSSLNLSPDAIADAPRSTVKPFGPFQLINVGTFDTWYKGPDLLLEAFSACVRRGVDLRLTFIGGGRYLHDAENIAKKLGVAKRVRFAGQLPFSAAVRSELDAADLFVLPSRAEGLPKAMVEAMARALPCIGTTVGGIPELLPPEDLVPPNDPALLSRCIEEVLADPHRRAAMSARNLATAQEYRAHILRERRNSFYRVLRSRTAEWLKVTPTSSLVTTDCA